MRNTAISESATSLLSCYGAVLLLQDEILLPATAVAECRVVVSTPGCHGMEVHAIRYARINLPVASHGMRGSHRFAEPERMLRLSR